jgi:hypothetical protein
VLGHGCDNPLYASRSTNVTCGRRRRC